MCKGSIFAGRAPNSRANFLRKMLSRKIRERKLKVCMFVDNSLKTSWLLQPEAKFAHAGKRLTVEGPLRDSSKCCTIGGHAKKLAIYPA